MNKDAVIKVHWTSDLDDGTAPESGDRLEEIVAKLVRADSKVTEDLNTVNENMLIRTSTYTHTQAKAASVWNIAHNLNRYPSVTVVDSAGTQVYGDVEYTDTNNVVITFTAAFGGKAYLN